MFVDAVKIDCKFEFVIAGFEIKNKSEIYDDENYVMRRPATGRISRKYRTSLYRIVLSNRYDIQRELRTNLKENQKPLKNIQC